MRQFMDNKKIRFFIWILVLSAISLLVIQRHQHTGFFNWRSKMWGDAAGYYAYLPAWIIYGFDASKLPENIVEHTGEGFTINEDGKIITRYTCGVAMMQLPFFTAIHVITGFTGNEQDGFSGLYHLVSSVAAIFYSFFGLLFLWTFLRNYYNRFVTSVSLLSVYLGTNLLYYTIDATGMSHIYSFFLFSALLMTSKLFWTEQVVVRRNLLFAVIVFLSSLIVLVRPTNLVFVGLVLILDIHSWDELTKRLKKVLSLHRIIIAATIAFLVFLPQMIYWKYSSGNYLTDSYEGYGFTNLTSPQILKFLFAANNGLLAYNPIYFIVLFALVYMIYKKQHNGYFILGVFLSLVYLFSSWFIFSFGCGYGSRNFVEYTAIFSLPLGYLFRDIQSRKIRYGRPISFIIIFFVLVNLKLTAAYDKCFLHHDWDYKEYAYFLQSRRYNKRILRFKKEMVPPSKEFSKTIRVNLKNTTLVNYRRALVSADVEIYGHDTEAALVLTIFSNDTTLNWNGHSLKHDYDFERSGEKQRLIADFWLPRNYTTDSEIVAYLWNYGKDSIQISNLRLHLR